MPASVAGFHTGSPCTLLLNINTSFTCCAGFSSLAERNGGLRQKALASSVGYGGAATVKFLYGLTSQQYYFLELNGSLQVCSLNQLHMHLDLGT